MIEVVTAEELHRVVFAQLYELYSYDFSTIHGLDVGDDGRFGDDDLAGCWTNSHRHPHFIKVDRKLAGFAIVDRGSHLSSAEGVWDMAEFFVMRRYRRQGIGEQAAVMLFNMFPGQWEIRQSGKNTEAQAFWRRVIGHYTGGDYHEYFSDDECWSGPVQSFATR